eukprot:scaffold7885_cov175-Ochromonas_danica.AAC.2
MAVDRLSKRGDTNKSRKLWVDKWIPCNSIPFHSAIKGPTNAGNAAAMVIQQRMGFYRKGVSCILQSGREMVKIDDTDKD